MNFSSMEYFVVLAQERNFTRAAERLHMTQQSLSSHIAAMEKELGCQLFVRHIPLDLTYAGEVMLRYAGNFQKEHEKMLRDAHSFSVRYEKLEVLSETSILVAVPASSEPLSSLHNRIEMAFGEHLDRWTRGETWYPHTTLLCDPAADLNTLCNEMRKHFAPFEAHIEQIEFSRVEENGYIPVEINVGEAWSLNVYIDRHESALNEELDNVTYSHVDIQASVMNGDDEVPLTLGDHNIIYEFKFTNTTSIYSPDAYISESNKRFN